MPRHLRPFAILPALVLVSCGLAQDLDSRIRARVEPKLEEYRKEASFPGATFGWALADGRSGSVAAGVADLDTGAPMMPTSRMLAGSTGKTFFAAWILRLVDEGRLDLDKPISAYLGSADWLSRVPNGKDLTLRLLLRHQSGIAEQVFSEGLQKRLRDEPNKNWTPLEMIGLTFDTKPLFPAGQGWSYADMNYILAAIVAESVTGKKAYDEIARLFLVPLKLTNTIPSTGRVLPGLIQGHVVSGVGFTGGNRGIVDGKFAINPQFEWAGGGFVSTAHDLAQWTQALFGGSLFKPATSLAQKDGVRVAPNSPRNLDEYGLGCQIFIESDGKGHGHGGFFPGYLTETELMPSGVAVAIQYNADGPNSLLRNRRRYLVELARIVEEEVRRVPPLLNR